MKTVFHKEKIVCIQQLKPLVKTINNCDIVFLDYIFSVACKQIPISVM